MGDTMRCTILIFVADLKALSNLRLLERLDLSYGDISHNGLAYLAVLTGLRALQLSGCSVLTPEGNIGMISNLLKLTLLDVSHCR